MTSPQRPPRAATAAASARHTPAVEPAASYHTPSTASTPAESNLNTAPPRSSETSGLAGDPDWEVTVAWQCYQQLRSIYHARTPADGRKTAEHVINSFPTCPINEVARLGKTLRSWRAQVLAYFDTGGVSNGGTEAINLIIEKTRRIGHGFRNFGNYRPRILLAASGTRTYRRAAAHG